jgi:hypothetical protein
LTEFLSLLPDADRIERWAIERSEAQEDLAQLIRDLIAETAMPTHLDVPTGRAVVEPGWDGIVTSPGNAWVPAGRSCWEWSVGAPEVKAQENYRKRTDNTPEAERNETTFAFVTPRRWPGRREWVERKQAETMWRDVRVIDPSQLEGWLRTAFGTHLWLAERIDGSLAPDVRTVESCWREWADRFWPPLAATPALVLAGREAEAEAVCSWLGAAGYHFFQCDTVEEGVAFLGAAFLSGEVHAAAARRAAVVSSPHTMSRLLAMRREPMTLVAAYPNAWAREAVEQGHLLIEPVDLEREGAFDFRLRRAKETDLTAALLEMGLEPERAARIARSTKGQMVPLQREISGRPIPAAWSTGPVAKMVAAAAMAGRWNSAVPGDQAAVAGLTGTDYVTVEAALVELTIGVDSPVQRVGTLWSVTARLDAWRKVARTVGEAEWTRYETTALDVLGARDPAFDLPPEERWMANIKDKGRPYSDDLRQGLAEGLAMLAVQSGLVFLPRGRNGADVSTSVVRRLLRAATNDRTGETWASLDDQLPFLAEAAPNVFIEEVRLAAHGREPMIAKLMVEKPGMISPRSRVVGLLWALERLAWSAQFVSAVAEILVRLASLDPGIKSGNRPANSFVEIFRCWHPQTSASAGERLAALDAAISSEPGVTWPLLRQLLPTPHDIGMNTSRPDWRDWAPSDEVRVSTADYWSLVSGLVERLIGLADQDAKRWSALIEAYPDLPPDLSNQVLDGLRALTIETMSPADLGKLNTTLAETVANHRTFTDAEWAIAPERVAVLEGIAARFVPPDPVLEYVWLFDIHPSMERVAGRDYHEYDSRLSDLRKSAIGVVLRAKGLSGVEELVDQARQPRTVGWSLGQVARSDDADDAESRLLDWAASADEPRISAAEGYLAARGQEEGWAWLEATMRSSASDWGPDRAARFLAATWYGREAWRLAADLGPEIERAYWTQFGWYPSKGDEWEAAERLIEFGRPFAAIQRIATGQFRKETPFQTEIAFQALDAAAKSTVPPPPADAVGMDHEVAEVISALDAEGFDETRLADIEWVFARVLEHQPQALKHLHRRLSREPAFFVEIITLIFKADDQERAEEPDPEHVRYAQHAFRLLHTWKGPIPGQSDSGDIDVEALMTWVGDAREKLGKARRSAIGDQRIGHVLWYSPPGLDGVHPHEGVRDLFEALGADDIETGFQIEAVNSRGVAFRGRGGDQERELAAGYAGIATALGARWPRTAAIFRGLEERYEHLGRFEDERAEQEEL